MDFFEKQYGIYSLRDKKRVSEVTAESLIKICQSDENPWLKKDAAMFLFGLVLDHLTGRNNQTPDNSTEQFSLNMLNQLRVELPNFYAGNGFHLDLDFSPLYSHNLGKSGKRLGFDDEPSILRLKNTVPNEFDYVFGIHMRGNEAAIMVAHQLGLETNFLFQYKAGPDQETVHQIYADFPLTNKRVLLVDDGLKTGSTIADCLDYVSGFHPAAVFGVPLVSNEVIAFMDPRVKWTSINESFFYYGLK